MLEVLEGDVIHAVLERSHPVEKGLDTVGRAGEVRPASATDPASPASALRPEQGRLGLGSVGRSSLSQF